MKVEMVKDGHLGGFFPGGDPGTWCPQLWTWAVRRFNIRSVLDVGCGEGQSTLFFRQLGCDVLGVEGSQLAIDRSVIPDAVVKHDFCEGPFQPGRTFDLIWSCEFLEHIEEQYVPNLLQTFALADKQILVTHAFPGQRGHHHVNCRVSSYWIELFERSGYDCQLGPTRAARRMTLLDYPGINHFARSGLVFGKVKETNAEAGREPLCLQDVQRLGREPSSRSKLKGLVLRCNTRWSKTVWKLRRAVTGRKRAA